MTLLSIVSIQLKHPVPVMSLCNMKDMSPVKHLRWRFQRKWLMFVKDTLNAFGDFKSKQKSVWINVFPYVKVAIFWKCIQYTIHQDKTQILKKFALGKIDGTKNVVFFLLGASIHQSSTFNLRFLYVLKNKVRLFKMCVGFSIFVKVKVYIFFSKVHELFDFKTS